MDSRRRFIGQVATGLAGTLAVPSSVLGASNRIRVGVIGVGERGAQLAREALACGNVELAGFADIYPRRLEAARSLAPQAACHADHRRLLEDRGLDAVLIATPQHLHAQHCIDALESGKHVYLEKTMAFTVDQAKRMRTAYERAGRRTVQIGHQACSSGLMDDALRLLASGRVGKISAIRAHMYRNTPHGKPQWSRPVFSDITPESVAWERFLGEAPPSQFDAQRFVNWRFYWDYSGGNMFENMIHQVGFWFGALDLGIPLSVTTAAANFRSPKMQVPDTMNVNMHMG